MPRKKTSRLSQYLRDEANRFLVYPEKLPRGVRPRDGRFGVDELWSAIAEARRTFTRPGYTLRQAPETQQRILDDTYCREVLKEVPGMVRRTMELGELQLPDSQAQFWAYLRESSKCLILGLPQASVALARAAMEPCLGEAYTKFPGNKPYATRQNKLISLITRLSKSFDLTKGQFGLSEQEREDATSVSTIAGGVLHDAPITEELALTVFNKARSVIQGVAERSAKLTK